MDLMVGVGGGALCCAADWLANNPSLRPFAACWQHRLVPQRHQVCAE